MLRRYLGKLGRFRLAPPGGTSGRSRAAPCILLPLIYTPGGVGKVLLEALRVGAGSAVSGTERG